MKLHHRRIIYISFIAAFLISAAILVPYSGGYRYDAKSGRIVKTGSLVIDSRPKNALIRLEGEEQKLYFFQQLSRSIKKVVVTRELKEKTPVIFNLKPSEYLVEVSRDGYYTWNKKLGVYSKQATFADQILLFLKEPEIDRLASRKIVLAGTSPDGRKMAVVAETDKISQLEVMDLETRESKIILDCESPITDMEWSPSSKKLLVVRGDGSRMVITEEGPQGPVSLDEKIFAEKASAADLKDLRWDLESDDSLYGRLDDTVYKIGLFAKTMEEMPGPEGKSFSDYLAKGEQLYYSIPGKSSFVEKIAIRNGALDGRLSMPVSENCSFAWKTSPREDLLLAKDKADGSFSLVNFDAADPERATLLKSEAHGMQWSKDGKKLLYYSDFEIWTYDLEKDKAEMLARYSEPVLSAIWHPSGHYVTFATNEAIKALEIDGRDKRNEAVLVETEAAHEFTIYGDDKPDLFLAGEVGGEKGIFKVRIQ